MMEKMNPIREDIGGEDSDDGGDNAEAEIMAVQMNLWDSRD